MKFVMETSSIFGDWGQDRFRAISSLIWDQCTFHIRQLIVRARSRLCWSNLACENSFILSLRIYSVQDLASGLLFIQYGLVSVNENWVCKLLLIYSELL